MMMRRVLLACIIVINRIIRGTLGCNLLILVLLLRGYVSWVRDKDWGTRHHRRVMVLVHELVRVILGWCI